LFRRSVNVPRNRYAPYFPAFGGIGGPSLRLLEFSALPVSKSAPQAEPDLTTRHLRFGWWSLALFGTLGLVLETLHGFKIGAYLDVSNETRRLMWTLAHAHGTLLGLVHLGFAATVRLANLSSARLGTASTALLGATVLLPGGFFLGGIRFYAGDPGIGVALVPVGAAMLIYAAVIMGRLLGSKP
jgi:hypothetical protein